MGRARILYIEDNAANLALVRKVLEHAGRWEVVGAATGEEGLALVDAGGFALVLLDLDLPGIDGMAVARRLRQDARSQTTPILALSAGVMKHEREQALAAGCDRFLEKPFDIAELRRTVQEMIGAS